MNTIQKSYNRLVKEVEYHNNAYYNNDQSLISDYEYDKLTQRLRAMEEAHPELVSSFSPSVRVGGKCNFNPIEHNIRMLSIQDVFDKEKLIMWVEDILTKVPNPKFIVEPKIDGLSLTLRYRYGELYLAETRGDGVIGEEVTVNAMQIDDIPKLIDTDIEYVELRGEVYMTKDRFKYLNDLENVEARKFANPRNAAAGTLRQGDPSVVKDRQLSFMVFNLQTESTGRILSHLQSYDWMLTRRIKHIPKYYICQNSSEIQLAIDNIGKARESFDYPIDGAVVKVDSYEHRDILGETSKCPRWAIAFKYPAEIKETTVTDILVTVGRTGKFTPVAVFNPISLCGTTVHRATIHNQDEIDRLGINIGSGILVYKSGEIIPKIKSVVDLPWCKAEPYKMSLNCPVCGMEGRKEGPDIYCINPFCQARINRSIEHFASRQAMNIHGLGPKVIDTLVRNKLVCALPDIYGLENHAMKLYGLIGEKNTLKLIKEIEASKGRSLEHLLYALGIPGVGITTARQIALYFGDMSAFMRVDLSDLSALPGVGEILGKGIIKFIRDPAIITLIETLESYDINMFVNIDSASDKLKGYDICITGEFETYHRDDLKGLIEANGGHVVSPNKCNYILVGANPGNAKLKIAEKRGVDVLDIQFLLNIIA